MLLSDNVNNMLLAVMNEFKRIAGYLPAADLANIFHESFLILYLAVVRLEMANDHV